MKPLSLLSLLLCLQAWGQSPPWNTTTNRPPYTWYPYPTNSLWQERIPAGATLHDIIPANYGLPASSAAAMVNCALTGCGAYSLTNSGAVTTGAMPVYIQSSQSNMLPGQEDNGRPIYYTQPSDPYYHISGGCSFETFFNARVQIPNQAYRTGKSDSLPGGSDGGLIFYDQAQGILGLQAGGGCTSGCPSQLPSCSGTTPATACSITGNSTCSAERPNIDKDWGWISGTDYTYVAASGFTYHIGGPGGNMSYAAAGASGADAVTRFEEFGIDVNQNVGQILHAFGGTIGCVKGQVFPATSAAFDCSGVAGMSTTDQNNHPPNGALLYCDYTDGQIASMNLPPFQNTLLTAMCHFGFYPSITQNGNLGAGPLGQARESELAYSQATGHHHPIFQWLQGQKLGSPNCNGSNCPVQVIMSGNGNSPPHSEYRFGFNALYGIPPVGTDSGTNESYVLNHFHIADPCIIVGLAISVGSTQTGSCVALPPSCTPTSGTVPLTITCTNPNAGTTKTCLTTNGSIPVTNFAGTGCTTGTAYSAPFIVSAAGTLQVVSGTSKFTDSDVIPYTYTTPTVTPQPVPSPTSKLFALQSPTPH